jgi:dihydrolipoamide dehydrogenase
MRYAKKAFREVRLKTKVIDMATSGKQIKVVMDAAGEQKDELYDRVLVSVGRVPNCEDLGLENTKIERDEKGFIKVNQRQETADPAIYAIGDVAGGVLLAHKASKEARIAVEVMTGEASAFENIIIPAVVFTEPEVAWCGLTEAEAKAKGIAIAVAKFPWAASGRHDADRTDGLTKLIIEPESKHPWSRHRRPRCRRIDCRGRGCGRNGRNGEGFGRMCSSSSHLVGDAHGMR